MYILFNEYVGDFILSLKLRKINFEGGQIK